MPKESTLTEQKNTHPPDDGRNEKEGDYFRLENGKIKIKGYPSDIGIPGMELEPEQADKLNNLICATEVTCTCGHQRGSSTTAWKKLNAPNVKDCSALRQETKYGWRKK